MLLRSCLSKGYLPRHSIRVWLPKRHSRARALSNNHDGNSYINAGNSVKEKQNNAHYNLLVGPHAVAARREGTIGMVLDRDFPHLIHRMTDSNLNAQRLDSVLDNQVHQDGKFAGNTLL